MKKKQSMDPDRQFKRAVSALEKGQFQQALRHLERLLPQAGENAALAEQVHLAMADAYLSQRDLSQAVSHAETVLELNGDNDQAYYLLGFVYSIEQAWDESVSVLQRAAELAPDNAEYQRALGWAVFNQGDAARGRSLLEQALELAPTHVPTLTDLAMLHASEQQYDMAVIFARRAVELAPGDPQAQEVFAVLSHFKSEFHRLSDAPEQEPVRPTSEAEWRELIARTGSFQDLVQLWFDLHPAQDLDEVNKSLQELQALWNSTPRPELGGRSPDDILGDRP